MAFFTVTDYLGVDRHYPVIGEVDERVDREAQLELANRCSEMSHQIEVFRRLRHRNPNDGSFAGIPSYHCEGTAQALDRKLRSLTPPLSLGDATLVKPIGESTWSVVETVGFERQREGTR